MPTRISKVHASWRLKQTRNLKDFLHTLHESCFFRFWRDTDSENNFFKVRSSLFLHHTVIEFSNLLCFILMTYSNIIILKTSRKKKLTKDKTELNHNIQWCPLINLRRSFIHNYDNTLRQYHKQWLTRASQCFRKTKIRSSGASFILFWQSKQKRHHFRTWWKMKIKNLSFITTLRLQSVTLELRSIERITLTCCLRPPFLHPFQCWPQTRDNSTEKPL